MYWFSYICQVGYTKHTALLSFCSLTSAASGLDGCPCCNELSSQLHDLLVHQHTRQIVRCWNIEHLFSIYSSSVQTLLNCLNKLFKISLQGGAAKIQGLYYVVGNDVRRLTCLPDLYVPGVRQDIGTREFVSSYSFWCRLVWLSKIRIREAQQKKSGVASQCKCLQER